MKIRKILIALLSLTILFGLSACGETNSETVKEPAATEESIVEESKTEEVAPALTDEEKELLGAWGEPKGEGHLIIIKEDKTLSVYEHEGTFPEGGDLIHTNDGSWSIEDGEVCITINGETLYYTFEDDDHNFMSDRDMMNFYSRMEDDYTLPE